jgi:drug/metabolite transporter (DMT)-like permease
MIRLITLGIIAGVFFSTTFVLNEAMRLGGGHWLWSASLRYLFMLILLILIILIKGGIKQLKSALNLFLSHWKFWIITGCLGFGPFYALICFSAEFSPGWVVAATWQFTVVASLFIFTLFGRTFPKRVWFFSLIIFMGVILVNLSSIDEFSLKALLTGGAPVFAAAFLYPFGNQLVWEAKNGNNKKLPSIKSNVLNDIFNKVFLMTLGSVPLWIVLVLTINPPPPSISQIFNSSLVALFSGVLGTSLFLYSRNSASNSNELAGVDATQSSEVVFALLGGLLFLGTELPGITAVSGLFLIFTGLFLFVKYQ